MNKIVAGVVFFSAKENYAQEIAIASINFILIHILYSLKNERKIFEPLNVICTPSICLFPTFMHFWKSVISSFSGLTNMLAEQSTRKRVLSRNELAYGNLNLPSQL
jgi:hypothetical protein